jgi:hypothetical protein
MNTSASAIARSISRAPLDRGELLAQPVDRPSVDGCA